MSMNENLFVKNGVKCENLMTSGEALKKANLDWDVQVEPVFLENGDEVKSNKAIVRQSDKKVFNVLGNRYTPLQNTEAFEFFDDVVGEGEAIYQEAGEFRDGSVIWLSAKMPDYIRIGNTDDLIEKKLLLINSHDGSRPVIVKVTPRRLICENMINAVMKGRGDEIKVRHTKNMIINLEQGRKTLGLVNKIYDQLDDIFNRMYDIPITTNSMDNYLNNVLNGGKEEVATRTENTIMDVKRIYEEGAGVNDPTILQGEDNLWRLMNAVDEFSDHYKDYNSGTDVFYASTLGSGAKLKEKAFKEAVKMLN